MITFIKNIYYRIFTYKQEYEKNIDNFSEYANIKRKNIKRLSFFCHMVYLAFIVYAIIKIIECKQNHIGADLYFIELIVFSLMGIIAILTKRDKLLIVLAITALICSLGQYEQCDYFLQYLILAFCTGIAFYSCRLYLSLNYYCKLPTK